VTDKEKQAIVLAAMQAEPNRWLTNAEIHARLPALNDRAIRQQTFELARLGLIEQEFRYPKCVFRWRATDNSAGA
jgi:alpha-D-ribose 1-methylphosphonate 5-phosphate C-P lyase